ncbi:MAG: hypothetical protein KC613_02760, partial [Myxococcales bacterium]|nr:hypothetical protein [Myxococcales bacterium]
MPWEVEPQALRWHPAFETGVAAVDGGHRRVFAAAADALDAMVQGRPDDELIVRVARLDTELHAHLLPEEAAWAAVDPTDALVQAHRASHQQVPPPERAASAADPGLAQTVQHLADALAWFCH